MSEREVRNALDLNGIDSIDDLDGDVRTLDVNLNDLSPGNVVTFHEPEQSHKYLVTGRHESRTDTSHGPTRSIRRLSSK